MIKETRHPGGGLGRTVYVWESSEGLAWENSNMLYAGELLNAEQVEKNDSRYIMQISNDKFLDAVLGRKGKGRHICHPGPARNDK